MYPSSLQGVISIIIYTLKIVKPFCRFLKKIIRRGPKNGPERIFHMVTYKIHLIRHGLTESNLKGCYTGSTDSPLCAEGKAELQRLSEEFDYPGAAQVITSPMLRCLQTASILYPHREYLIVDNFRECDFGAFEGKTFDELREREDFRRWLEDSVNVSPPGGESTGEFIQRVVTTFSGLVNGLMRTKTTEVAMIVHGGVIMSILSALCYPKRAYTDWIVGNGMGYTLTTTAQLWMNGNVLEVTDLLPKGIPDIDREDQQQLYQFDDFKNI